jgi:hypothetical protein
MVKKIKIGSAEGAFINPARAGLILGTYVRTEGMLTRLLDHYQDVGHRRG